MDDLTDTPTRSWVPTDTCTLPTPQQPLRVAEFAELFAGSLRTAERVGPTRLLLRLGGDAAVAARARTLVTREAECCTFFRFAVTRAGDEVHIDVRVPRARTAVLDGLQRQAEETRQTGEPTVA